MSLNTLNLDEKFTELSGIFNFVYNTLKNNEEVQMNLKKELDVKQSEIESYSKVSFITKMNKQVEKYKRDIEKLEQKNKKLQTKVSKLTKENKELKQHKKTVTIATNTEIVNVIENLQSVKGKEKAINTTETMKDVPSDLNEDEDYRIFSDSEPEPEMKLENKTKNEPEPEKNARDKLEIESTNELQKQIKDDVKKISEILKEDSNVLSDENTNSQEPEINVTSKYREVEIKMGRKMKTYFVDQSNIVFKKKANNSFKKLGKLSKDGSQILKC